jgi:hypothetical protein
MPVSPTADSAESTALRCLELPRDQNISRPPRRAVAEPAGAARRLPIEWPYRERAINLPVEAVLMADGCSIRVIRVRSCSVWSTEARRRPR